MPGVKKVVAIDGNAVVVVADTYWNARTALAALPTEWDIGKLGEVQNETITAHAEGRPRRQRSLRRQQGGRRQGRDRRRGQEGDGDLRLPLPAPCHHGADERHGALHRRQVRGVVRHAERRGGARRGVGGLRPAGRPVRGLQDDAGRRFRPARPRRLRPPGRPGRQGDARHAGQAHLVARRGHDARPVPSDHDVQADGRSRRPGQPGRPACPHLGPVDPGLAAAAEPA